MQYSIYMKFPILFLKSNTILYIAFLHDTKRDEFHTLSFNMIASIIVFLREMRLFFFFLLQTMTR